MRVIQASLAYFTAIFGIGFVLGVMRVTVLVPRLGERWAELLELPFMVLASYLMARACLRRFGPFTPGLRLAMGASALVLMVAAELGLTLILGRGIAEYLENRDPVSGSAYLVSLALFGLMPLLAGKAGGVDR